MPISPQLVEVGAGGTFNEEIDDVDEEYATVSEAVVVGLAGWTLTTNVVGVAVWVLVCSGAAEVWDDVTIVLAA